MVSLREVSWALFSLMLINDMCSISDNHNVSVKLFADDIKLYNFIDTNADYLSLQNHLNLLYYLSLDWQLGLSPTSA